MGPLTGMAITYIVSVYQVCTVFYYSLYCGPVYRNCERQYPKGIKVEGEVGEMSDDDALEDLE